MINALFSDFTTSTLLTMAALAFLAGFVDAVVGGGGLIQAPALLIAFPDELPATIFGTNKMAAISGTSAAAIRFSQKVKFNWPLLLVVSATAFLSAFLGAKTVSIIDVDVLKPVILVVLIVIAVYTFIKKDLGAVRKSTHTARQQLIYGALIGSLVGFYDGFFGPGTGSFLVLGFVFFLGFEFLKASAYAKIVNTMTNVSALIVFIRQGNFLLGVAVVMAISNIAGSIIGSSMAIKKGNQFIRVVFLVVVCAMIVRYAYDIWKAYL